MKVLLVDNYDSFTYNLLHLLEENGVTNTDVILNDELDLDAIERYSKIILSPGSGLPRQAGKMPALLQRWATQKSILGVCLGHQAIAEHFGASLLNMKEVIHGKRSQLTVIEENMSLFKGLPKNFWVGRYHSWLIQKKDLPSSLEITAVDEQGAIMAFRHKRYDLQGVQFHPESILTEYGARLLGNWLRT